MRVLTVIVLFAYLTNLGCTSMRDVPPSDVDDSRERIFAATYTSGRTVVFDKVVVPLAPEERNRTRGTARTSSIRYANLNVEAQRVDGTLEGQTVSIPVSELQTVQVQKFSAGKFAMWSLVGAVAFAGVSFIMIALSESSR